VNYPQNFTSYDRDYVNGEVYAPDAPANEYISFGTGEGIWFDYTVIPLGYGEFEVRVEVTGIKVIDGRDGVIDFEHVRTFEHVEDAQDWVYSFMGDDAAELSYEQTKALIRNGRE
jgi:hypothetical protein